MKRKLFFAVLSTLIILGPIISFNACAQSPSVIAAGKFSAEKPGDHFPEFWKPVLFKKIDRHTEYSLVKEDGVTVVKALAEASASGWMREMKIDPKEYPVIQWRWKVENILKKGNVSTKEGDDYPARLYVTFDGDLSHLSFFEKTKYEMAKLFYGQYPPTATLDYIWESTAPQGIVVPSPYTARAMMIVIESGPDKLKEWVDEERNLYEDFKKAFGYEPPMISGVAIMTDTDNTGEQATAYYGDILFKRKDGK